MHLINRCTMPITAASVELRDDLEANPLSNQEPDRSMTGAKSLPG